MIPSALRLHLGRYAFAVAVTALAALARAALVPLWGSQFPFITFFPAVAASAWFGGVGPGLTAAALSTVCAALLWPASAARPADLIAVGVFAGVGIFISLLTGMLHRTMESHAIALARARTARAEAEAGRAAMARLAAIVRDTDDAIITKTLEGVITSWNPAAERLFGYTSSDAVGHAITLIVPPDRLAEENEMLVRVTAGETMKHFETERLGSSRRRIPVSLTMSRVTDPAGRIVGVSTITRDITERKETEVALSELARRKDEFLAVVSHELRNPLAAIMSAATVLARHVAPSGALRPLDIIRRQTTQLARIVDDLLDVARLSSGKVDLRKAPLDLGAATESCVAMLAAAETSAHHRITVAAERAWIDADVVRVEQIITNLVTNAVKYTPAGGTIAVRVEAAGDDAVLRVKDDGIGIAPDVLPLVFDLFTQAEAAPVRRHGGLGIGLTVVRRLVELHAGRVDAYSEGEGRGSEFVVRFPRIEPAADARPAAIKSSLRDGHRVLVIEDSADTREALRALLEMANHEVHEADDGEAGIALAERVRPDVVLIDIGLPGVDGYEVARRLRAADTRMRLIALTGYADTTVRERALAAGFDAHLVKPVDYDQLLAAVRSTP